jgi:hypothetical protein
MIPYDESDADLFIPPRIIVHLKVDGNLGDDLIS